MICQGRLSSGVVFFLELLLSFALPSLVFVISTIYIRQNEYESFSFFPFLLWLQKQSTNQFQRRDQVNSFLLLALVIDIGRPFCDLRNYLMPSHHACTEILGFATTRNSRGITLCHVYPGPISYYSMVFPGIYIFLNERYN